MILITSLLLSLLSHADPRLTCDDLFWPPELRSHLPRLGFTPVMAERTAIVRGIWRAEYDGPRGPSKDVAVIVRPDGQVVVIDPNGGELIKGDPTQIIAVHEYGNTLRPKGEGWVWMMKPAPPELWVGDIPKGEFLAKYDDAIRALVRSDEWTKDLFNRGIVLEAKRDSEPVRVFAHETPAHQPKVWFFHPHMAEQLYEPAYGPKVMLDLKNGHRLYNATTGWRFLPPESYVQKLTEIAEDAGVRSMAAAASYAIEKLIRELPGDVDLKTVVTSEMRDDRSGQTYLVIMTPRASRVVGLYDTFHRDLVNTDMLKDVVLIDRDGKRLGFNLNQKSGWTHLSPAGEIEKLRALYPPPR